MQKIDIINRALEIIQPVVDEEILNTKENHYLLMAKHFLEVAKINLEKYLNKEKKMGVWR